MSRVGDQPDCDQSDCENQAGKLADSRIVAVKIGGQRSRGEHRSGCGDSDKIRRTPAPVGAPGWETVPANTGQPAEVDAAEETPGPNPDRSRGRAGSASQNVNCAGAGQRPRLTTKYVKQWPSRWRSSRQARLPTTPVSARACPNLRLSTVFARRGLLARPVGPGNHPVQGSSQPPIMGTVAKTMPRSVTGSSTPRNTPSWAKAHRRHRRRSFLRPAARRFGHKRQHEQP